MKQVTLDIQMTVREDQVVELDATLWWNWSLFEC